MARVRRHRSHRGFRPVWVTEHERGPIRVALARQREGEGTAAFVNVMDDPDEILLNYMKMEELPKEKEIPVMRALISHETLHSAMARVGVGYDEDQIDRLDEPYFQKYKSRHPTDDAVPILTTTTRLGLPPRLRR